MKKESSLMKAITLLMLITISTCLYAQTDKKSVFEAAIVKEFCDSFTKIAPQVTKENMSIQMGSMILPVMYKYSDDIKTEWGLDITDKDDIRKVGEKLGQNAAGNCPSFLKFVKDNLQDIVNDKMESSAKNYSGKILKIEGAPFTYLLVQNKQGKTEKIYWMEYFEGADKLTAQASSYLNKPVTINYTEKEVYQTDNKEYRVIKVITKVSF